MNPKTKIVLFQPEIPGNTGTIGRTCVALDFELILIKPYGFDLSEKEVRRAGLDYWKHVQLKEYNSFQDFISNEAPAPGNLFFFSRFGKKNYYKASYQKGCYLIFGRETSGLPEELFKSYPEHFYFLPTFSSHIRSLNLANTATAVAFEAIRQIEKF